MSVKHPIGEIHRYIYGEIPAQGGQHFAFKRVRNKPLREVEGKKVINRSKGTVFKAKQIQPSVRPCVNINTTMN